MGAFDGRLMVVAGGAGELGSAVVAELRGRGAEVVVANRQLPKEGSALPGVRYAQVDASHEASVRSFFDSLPRPPVALANVVGGYRPEESVGSLEVAQLQSMLELNLVTAAVLTKWAVQKMGPAGAGRIVHVSSRAGAEAARHSFAYGVSKLGVMRLCETVALETREQGLTINCVLPSIIDTPPNRAAMPKAEFGTWPTPAQVAKVIAFLLSDDAELVSGAAVPVYGRA